MPFPSDTDTFVFLENSRPRGFGDGVSHLFTDPADIVKCTDLAQVTEALRQVERGLEAGLYPAGYLSYELGYGFENSLRPLLPTDRDVPLLWFGLFRTYTAMDTVARTGFWADRKDRYFQVKNVRPNISEPDYLAAVGQVHEHLRRGDTYQVNLTFKLNFDFEGDPFAFMQALTRNQPVAYGALINTPGLKILSLSPELFVQKVGAKILSRPMKGTWTRGLDLAADQQQATEFAADEKSRAENLMIVDLIRNDLARISKLGTVRVEDRFKVETYQTLLQMTSAVAAEAEPDISLTEVFHALFPCGSVTGTPKISTMKIVHDLENEPRGIYTGAIGFAAQGGGGQGADFCFNVPIRTVVLGANGKGEMGVGSGIVADSVAEDEYRECLLKAKFLTDPRPEFQLIETLLWRPNEGLWLKQCHLDRLQASAQYFQFPLDAVELDELLSLHTTAFGDGPRRVRVLLNEAGNFSITSEAARLPEGPQSVVISKRRTQSDDLFLRHKTTNRPLYTQELETARGAGHLEVLFLNERGELTEGAISNFFADRGGVMLTPPVSCGLLPGTFRGSLLEDPHRRIEERVLMLADLEAADKIYVGNSVMGLVEMTLTL